ncbi:winged helix-turn-helix domain-containing tetratricopeptide repeat protein [Hoeflea prorocentri]|uniref:Winged helix-turn-helix domain-containing protein n=1 Tax=Hoeflea prorocentri TaxID=1922333 RepID=A0A9X3ZHM9_9HYPH|nr:winged helix-turn-helix domain-containing protein [Hoeflea prorocentri]MCY6381088.1 winged helix-turn-helix domain-containing protein [Hoeflea prorocentri]MDA5398888.1 winged helix-turn-helix domain-containing protein [Hoeflea prorocentri]
MESKTGIVIDLQQHIVTRGGERIALQRKAYDLLVFFAQNPGCLLTKAAILRGVWPDTHVTEGSVKDVVKQLRRALADDPANPSFIATERGLGYRFLGGISIQEEDGQPKPQGPRKTPESVTSPENPEASRAQELSTVPSWRMSPRWVVAGVTIAVLLLSVFLFFRSINGSEHQVSYERPARPSIAVMPFANMSADPDQDYFAEGMTDDLITDLSQLSGLFVIARNSTSIYTDQTVSPQKIARDLGVRFLLLGSVRRSDEQLRINAQLVDTDTGSNLWAERFDGPAENVLELQTRITRKIVTTLEVRLSDIDNDHINRVETKSAAAHDHVLRGHQLFRRMTPQDNRAALRSFEQALSIDPNYARAQALLGWSHWMATVSGWNMEPLQIALTHAEQALEMDRTLVSAYALRGKVYLWQKRHEEAELELRTAVSLEPSDYSAQGHLGDILVWSGKPDEAFVALERSLRLSPNDGGWILTLMGLAHFIAERDQDAVQTLDRALVRNPSYFWAHLLRAAVLGEIDRQDEAKEALASALEINPEFSLEFLISAAPFKRDVDRRRVVAGLRNAGLQD